MGQEFVRRTFTAETKAKTVDMTQRIEKAMENEINALDWMTPATKTRAMEKLHAVANKVGYPDRWRDYSALENKRGDFIGNATRTSGEDVADLGGTLLAYIAWQDATSGQNLPSADGFSPDQRFFIGFAQWACENQRPENLRVNAITNPHSPGKYRVNGIVSDMPEFQRAFNCGEGSPMVRGSKACKVW